MSARDDSAGLRTIQSELRSLFYEQLDCRTSACLFGSAATGNWVPDRSDIDLIVLVTENQVATIGQIIARWKAEPGLPILDGYALFLSRNVLMAIHLEAFHKGARPAVSEIQLVDWWYIKYRSKRLFGTDFVQGLPEIALDDLAKWARNELKRMFGPSHSGDIPNAKHVLSSLIWSVSWSGRLLMLAKGMICDSKFEAIKWLGQEYPEIREPLDVLLADFFKADTDPIFITAEQSETVRRYLLKKMMLEARAC